MSDQAKSLCPECADDVPVDRRDFIRAFGAATAVVAAGGVAESAPPLPGDPPATTTQQRLYLTNPPDFVDVSRGNPRPHTLKGEQLVKARLTPQTWRLEIVSDGTTQIATPHTLDKGNALDLPALEKLGKQHSRKFLKAMQCLNIAQPLGQGLWEGVPLREVVKLVGRLSDIRRIYYWGYHNNDPKQLFQSSLNYTQVMEAPPSDLGPFVAYRLNGQPIPLVRGGPVRMIVPWAHGFKSIKWLQRIVLTNNFQANDTYAAANNDPESYLKTAAYVDSGPAAYQAGQAIVVTGTVMVGLSGLRRVEYWLRHIEGNPAALRDDDPAWATAKWLPCQLEPAPKNWGGALPNGVLPGGVWGFDPKTGQPLQWPMRYSWGLWSATLRDLQPGTYEFRARAVDQNDFAQPEPRPYQKSGKNEIQTRQIVVRA
jgi:DMSO/TMAO reductase YedYZ molybdopterin-dependent catalytic subunit